jgi:hypothetical protein
MLDFSQQHLDVRRVFPFRNQALMLGVFWRWSRHGILLANCPVCRNKNQIQK